jgi:raffinose/stachyose/melibiose transport system substrate-binding protein
MVKSKWIFMVLAAILLLSIQAVSAQDVTIDWWHINTTEAEAAFYQALADEFMAANPGVTIEITILGNADFKPRLTTVMQAGDPPDLFQSWGGGVLWQFADAGLVRDISPELNAGDGAWKNSFSAQAALSLYSQGEAYYGVPVTWGAVGVFYNKALFAQAGLDPENPPATWDEFIAAVEALKAAGITPISLGELEKWPGHFWWVYLAIRLGGEDAFLAAYDRSGSFADEPFVQAGEYLEQLVALEPFPDGFLGLGYGDQFTYFANGSAGMELMGQWAPNLYNSVEGSTVAEDLGWFPFPTIEGGAGNPDDVLGGGDGFAVGANAPDETVAFLQYITSVENQSRAAEIWIVPTVAGAEEVVTDDPIIAAIVEARNNAPYFQLYYDQFLPPALGGEVNDAVETIFAGTGSAADAAARIEDVASFELEAGE